MRASGADGRHGRRDRVDVVRRERVAGRETRSCSCMFTTRGQSVTRPVRSSRASRGTARPGSRGRRSVSPSRSSLLRPRTLVRRRAGCDRCSSAVVRRTHEGQGDRDRGPRAASGEGVRRIGLDCLSKALLPSRGSGGRSSGVSLDHVSKSSRRGQGGRRRGLEIGEGSSWCRRPLRLREVDALRLMAAWSSCRAARS